MKAMGGVIKDNRVGGVLMPTRSADALRAPPFHVRIKRKELKRMTAMGGVIKDNRVGGVLMLTRSADALRAHLLCTENKERTEARHRHGWCHQGQQGGRGPHAYQVS
jgi:hypothetical protein